MYFYLQLGIGTQQKYFFRICFKQLRNSGKPSTSVSFDNKNSAIIIILAVQTSAVD
jgi:hypothetical protein